MNRFQIPKMTLLKNKIALVIQIFIGRKLPDCIIDLIFEFDDTYRPLFNKCLNQFSKGCYDRRRPAHHYINSKYGGRDVLCPDGGSVRDEQMAVWFDNLYLGDYGDIARVHMDGRYIKPLMYYRALPVVGNWEHMYGLSVSNEVAGVEFKMSPGDYRWVREVYMYTYYSGHRNWHNSCTPLQHFRFPLGTRQIRKAKGLPIYTDKARFKMYVNNGKKINIVSKILKNIKKWETYNPELCNY